MRKLAVVALLCLSLAILVLPLFASTSFGIWQPKGNIIASNSCGGGVGICANPSVIYRASGCIVIASPCYGMWAFNQYGVAGIRGIYYFESADGFTSWSAYASNPMILDSAGNTFFPTVYIIGGTFYIFAGDGQAITEWTSANGVTGLTAVGSIITPGTTGTWDASGVFQLNIIDTITGTTYGYYAGKNASNLYQQGCVSSATPATGPWTKCGGNPIFAGPGPTDAAQATFYKQGSTYYAYASGFYSNAYLQTQGVTAFFRYSSSSVTGPWSILVDPASGNQIPIYYANTPFDFSCSTTPQVQIGDPELTFPPDGSVHMYYDSGCIFGVQTGISAAVIPHATLAQLVTSYEGVLNVPVSGFPQRNLLTLASDSGAGANASPIGGNWTPLVNNSGSFGTSQRLANNFAVASTAHLNAPSWWNVFAWGADQWSQTTAQICNNEYVGVAVRENTSNAATQYQFLWHGTLGGTGTWQTTKYVAATPTVLYSGTSLTLNQGDTMMLVAIGTNVYFYWNGYLLSAVSDSAISSGSAGFDVAAVSNVANSGVNNWKGGTFQSTSASIGGKAGVGGKAGIGK